MTNAYVDGKVREALTAANGSKSVAQQLLITWAATDERLLLGMAQPFLKAIAGAAVDGAVRRGAAGGRGAAARASGRGLSREALEQVLNRLGEDPAPQPGGTASRAGTMQVATTVLARGQKAPDGMTHEKSMMTLAKAFAAKKMR